MIRDMLEELDVLGQIGASNRPKFNGKRAIIFSGNMLPTLPGAYIQENIDCWEKVVNHGSRVLYGDDTVQPTALSWVEWIMDMDNHIDHPVSDSTIQEQYHAWMNERYNKVHVMHEVDCFLFVVGLVDFVLVYAHAGYGFEFPVAVQAQLDGSVGKRMKQFFSHAEKVGEKLNSDADRKAVAEKLPDIINRIRDNRTKALEDMFDPVVKKTGGI